MTPQRTLPDYGGANVCGIIPRLLAPRGTAGLPGWFPAPLHHAAQVVVLVIDGLGWEQLGAFAHLAPTISAMIGGPITTIAPSTTSTALTSIVTGLEPGEHGILGYRMDLHGDVLNVLRWATDAGDARRRHRPRDIQPFPAFTGERVTVVSRADLAGSGFTEAHLAGANLQGWRTPSNLAVRVGEALGRGERLVYAYYDGIDKVAHEFGFGAYYDAELSAVDRLVGDVLDVLPAGAALAVIADHGQVHVGSNTLAPAREVLAHVRQQSGEGRFRWLHARRGAEADLLAAAHVHDDLAWVVSREQVLDERWLGRHMAAPIAARLGDVALVPHAPVSFTDPKDSGLYELVCRHGSLTSAEMLVPFVAARPRA